MRKIINPFNTRLLNITRIIEHSDSYERSFQNWLKENGVWWSQRGSNLNNITIYDEDFQFIKESVWGNDVD